MAVAGAGHVNMMDDVLISHLPPVLLRSALRLLISQGAATQRPFVEHIRSQILKSPPVFTDASTLFPPGNDGRASRECLRYIASTRCIFSSKLAEAALPYLQEAEVRWAPGDELGRVLDHVSGDIVQAIQALKECKPETTSALFGDLQDLLNSLRAVSSYCFSMTPQSLGYPFTRAERQLRDGIGFLYPGAVALLSSPGAAKGISMSAAKRRADIETFQLGPHHMPRVFNGLWQLSSPAWGSASSQSQEAALAELVELGLSTADHYGDAELIYGDFRNRLPADIRDTVHAATKWCVFGPVNKPLSTQYVLQAVQERSRRLGGRVELLQFHWHDYSSHEYLDILVELVKITQTHPELVSAIGLCNFDAQHTEHACEYLVKKTGRVGLVSNQVQFSLIDSRPLQFMSAVCEKFGIRLLTYGCLVSSCHYKQNDLGRSPRILEFGGHVQSLMWCGTKCGGFLSPKWLGQPTPELYSETRPLTPSQRKIWGSWHEFQVLLKALSSVARKHGEGISLTSIASRWVLQQPAVGAIIVGNRLGVSNHAVENLDVFKFKLDEDDMEIINRVSLGEGGQKTKAVFARLGDCGNEYRAMH